MIDSGRTGFMFHRNLSQIALSQSVSRPACGPDSLVHKICHHIGLPIHIPNGIGLIYGY
jgi:hypothetical protein